MKINADFAQRVVVHSDAEPWTPSPMLGVHRRMLDRIGDEVARATTIVRYAPKSHFSAHVHSGGEEFFVLSGVFQDEHGDFPAGSYVRNPPTSKHTPGSDEGCVIFVKLRQFDLLDRTQVMIDTNKMRYVPHPSNASIACMPLFSDSREDVTLQKWAPHAHIQMDAKEGAELLVLRGSFTESEDTLTQHAWLRAPIGSHLDLHTSSDGATVWVKKNHLRDALTWQER